MRHLVSKHLRQRGRASSSPTVRDLAREAATRNVELAVQQVANLVLNVSALADRMEARQAGNLDEARERRERVKVLRDAAQAGREAIRRATADLAGEQDAELGAAERQVALAATTTSGLYPLAVVSEGSEGREQVPVSLADRHRLADGRDRRADERDATAADRDRTADARDRTADAREERLRKIIALADERDLQAEARDRAAEARDAAADRRDAREEGSDPTAAAADRAASAVDRYDAGADRDWSAGDRADLLDVAAHAVERREHAAEDRFDSSVDRVAAGVNRADAGADRDAAQADRQEQAP